MSLPTLNVPTETIKLFSVPKPIKIRPYLVGEEKLLLMAQQAQEQNKDTKEVEKAIRQIIEQCSFGALDVNLLPIFDVSYLFLQLRAISLNNVITTQFRCKNLVPTGIGDETKACNTVVPVAINISDIKLTVPEGHASKVMLDDKTGITLHYPSATAYDAALTSADMASLLASCLHTIFKLTDTDAQVWEVKDQSAADIEAFVNGLTFAHLQKIRTTFFDTMPRLTHTFTFMCPKCAYTEDIVLQELEDFFD